MRPKDENKPQAIRAATVAEVMHSGLGGASVARIAQRAGVSPGTIYLYYPSKEALLQQVYLQIKREFHACAMAAIDPAHNSAQQLRALWFALYAHLSRHTDDLAYAEFISAGLTLDADSQAEAQQMAAEITAVLSRAVASGSLRKLPLASLRALLFAPGVHLARQAAVRGKPWPKPQVEAVFEAVWRSVGQAPAWDAARREAPSPPATGPRPPRRR